EPQVVAQRDAEALVAVGERLVAAGAAVAAALVPGDQRLAQVDHGHAHPSQAPVLARDALAFGQQAAAQAAALQLRPHREHAEVAGTVLLGDVGAGERAIGAVDHQHPAAGAAQVGAQHLGVDAGAGEEVGFGGPAGAAGLAAVGGRDARDEGGDVRLGGGAETGLHGGGFYGGRRVDARGGKRAAGYGIAAPAATAASGQQPADLLQRGHEGVDLLVRVVERHRRATGRGHA